MKYYLKILIPILIFMFSCNKDEDCLPKNTLNLDDGGELSLNADLKEVYADLDFKIFISLYTSPNGDGIRDVFVIYIENMNNNTSFISASYYTLNDDINDNSTTDPEEFLKEANLIISDNCDETFSTEDLNQLKWFPGFDPVQPPGIYKVELNLKLTNDTEVQINDTFEVI